MKKDDRFFPPDDSGRLSLCGAAAERKWENELHAGTLVQKARKLFSAVVSRFGLAVRALGW